MTTKMVAVAIAALVVVGGSAAAYVLLSDDKNDAGDPYLSITNSIGTTVNFYEPAQKVASMGLSFSTTLLELGCLDDMVMIDTYSAPGNSGISELGSIPSYSVGDGQQIAQILANGIGGFDKKRDVVFVYGYSYNANAIQSMEALGLKVVTYYPTTYEAGMEMVTSIGEIMDLNDEALAITDAMGSALTDYAQKLADNGIVEGSKVRAAYVSYSLSNMKIGNINSYSVILMKIAGGANPADDGTMSGTSLTSYSVDHTFFLQMNIGVIFLDPYYTGTPEEFRSAMSIPANVQIYHLEMVMNQYGPTSLDGIQFMAEKMYPGIFV